MAQWWVKWVVLWAAVTGLGWSASSEGVCGLSKRGLKVGVEGRVRDLGGWVRVVALVELSSANASLLSVPPPASVCGRPVPPPASVCGRPVPPPASVCGRPERQVRLLCAAQTLDQRRYQRYLRGLYEETGMELGQGKRPKRQILSGMAVGASGLAGFLASKLSGRARVADVEQAIRDLEESQDEDESRITKLGGEVTALTKMSFKVDAALGPLAEEAAKMKRFVPEAVSRLARTEALAEALVELATHRSQVEAAKDRLDHHLHLASQRYQGLVDAQAHRLSPAVIPPDVFEKRIGEIQDSLNDQLLGGTGKISFGDSALAAYAGSKVEYVDMVHLRQAGNVSRVVARLVFRTPYVSKRVPEGKLYSIRAFPYLANFTRGGRGKPKDFLRVHLRAPYVAVQEKAHPKDPEFYQLIQAEDLLDMGNGTFLNTRPGAFDYSASEASCEYRAVREAADEEDLCLLASKRVPSLRSFYHLRSGCWLLHEAGRLVEDCHPDKALKTLDPLVLFKPKCGCSYSSSSPAREFPVSWRTCARDRAFAMLLPSVGQRELAKALARFVPLQRKDAGDPDQRKASRTKREAHEEGLAALQKRLSGAPEETLGRAAGKMAAEKEVSFTRHRDHHRKGRKEPEEETWWQAIVHQIVLYVCAGVAVVVAGAIGWRLFQKLLSACCAPKTKPVEFPKPSLTFNLNP